MFTTLWFLTKPFLFFTCPGCHCTSICFCMCCFLCDSRGHIAIEVFIAHACLGNWSKLRRFARYCLLHYVCFLLAPLWTNKFIAVSAFGFEVIFVRHHESSRVVNHHQNGHSAEMCTLAWVICHCWYVLLDAICFFNILHLQLINEGQCHESSLYSSSKHVAIALAKPCRRDHSHF